MAPNSPQENVCGQKMTIDMLQYIGREKPDVIDSEKPFFVLLRKSVVIFESVPCNLCMFAPNNLITFHPYANVFFQDA